MKIKDSSQRPRYPESVTEPGVEPHPGGAGADVLRVNNARGGISWAAEQAIVTQASSSGTKPSSGPSLAPPASIRTSPIAAGVAGAAGLLAVRAGCRPYRWP